MVIFCTSCWMVNASGSVVCVRCGSKLETDGVDYISKLIRALGHREPDTVQRACWVLGELKSRIAVMPLISMLRVSRDPGALEAGVEALGKIGDEEALEILAAMALLSYLPVRLRAVEAIRNIGGDRAIQILEEVMKGNTSPLVAARAEEAIRELQQEGRVR